jgi:hypothetical protein
MLKIVATAIIATNGGFVVAAYDEDNREIWVDGVFAATYEELEPLRKRVSRIDAIPADTMEVDGLAFI